MNTDYIPKEQHSRLLPGLLIPHRNRTLYTTNRKLPGTYRIVFIGDSYTFGTGVTQIETSCEVTATLLNPLFPDKWIECINLGVPGSDIFQDLGRAAVMGTELEPDLLVFIFCSTDAQLPYDDAHQGMTEDAVGRRWLDLDNVMENAFLSFKKEMDGAGINFIFSYFELIQNIGSVRPGEVLAGLCSKLEIPFLDISEIFKDYTPTEFRVSTVDPHPNQMANQIAGRRFAQFILKNGFLNVQNAAFDDPSWIERIAPVADAMRDNGVPEFIALAKTRLLMEEKWLSRRNQHGNRDGDKYRNLVSSLLEREKPAAARLALDALTARIIKETECDLQEKKFLSGIEISLRDIDGLYYVLKYYSDTDNMDLDLAYLPYFKNIDVTDAAIETESFTKTMDLMLTKLETLSGNVSRSIASVVDSYNFVTEHETGCGDTRFGFLASIISNIHRLYLMLDNTIGRLKHEFARFYTKPPNKNIIRLMLLFVQTQEICGKIDDQCKNLGVVNLRRFGNIVLPSLYMHIEMEVTALPKSKGIVWGLTFSPEGIIPSYRDSYTQSYVLITDGRPHIYHVDIPFFFYGNIYFFMNGPDLPDHWNSGECLKIGFIRLDIPGLETRDLTTSMQYIGGGGQVVFLRIPELYSFE